MPKGVGQMAGNTRGKLKEHYEGVHRNLDWALHHVAQSASLIEQQLSKLPGFADVDGDPEGEKAFFMQHDVYKGTVALGESIQTLDGLAQGIYGAI